MSSEHNTQVNTSVDVPSSDSKIQLPILPTIFNSDAHIDNFDQPSPMTAEEIVAMQNSLVDAQLGLEKMTIQDKAQYVNQYMRCDKIKHDSLASRKIRFLFNSLAELGNPILAPEKFVQCVHCDSPLNAFALVTKSNQSLIGVCQNYAVDQSAVQDSIAHEMIHIYDQTRAYVDLDNCAHVACTEIRAAALSGECAKQREEARGILPPFTSKPGHFNQCVWRRARSSVKFNQLCNNDAVCDKAMNLTFDRCLADLAPFYAIPE